MNNNKLYKLLMVFVAALFITTNVNGQVTIGSNADPHTGAVLELKSNSTRGLILPKVNLTSSTVWSPVGGSAVDGMSVFNTSTSTANGLQGMGVYVWITNKWCLVSGDNSSGTIAVTGVTVSPTSYTLTSAGQTVQLTPTVSPTTATSKSVTWSSSNTAVATVSSTGLVTAVANGTAIITVTTTDGGKTATSTITISIDPLGTCGKNGTTGTLTVGPNSYLTHRYATGTSGAQQCWMVSNSKEGTPQSTAGSNGYFYSYSGAAQACPAGWHLPTTTEFSSLATILNENLYATQASWWVTVSGGGINGNVYNTGQYMNTDTGHWLLATQTCHGHTGYGEYKTVRYTCESGILSYYNNVRCVKN